MSNACRLFRPILINLQQLFFGRLVGQPFHAGGKISPDLADMHSPEPHLFRYCSYKHVGCCCSSIRLRTLKCRSLTLVSSCQLLLRTPCMTVCITC